MINNLYRVLSRNKLLLQKANYSQKMILHASSNNFTSKITFFPLAKISHYWLVCTPMTKEQADKTPSQNFTPIIILTFAVIALIVLFFGQGKDNQTKDINLSDGVVTLNESLAEGDVGFQTEGENDFLGSEAQETQPSTESQNIDTNQLGESNMLNRTQMDKPEMIIDQSQSYTALMKTNYGPITLELFTQDTPVTVNNFVYLSQAGFYDGLTFHRIISDFMIQGGCPLGNGTGSPGYQFQDEDSSQPLIKGSLAMANSGPNTNCSQFFIVTADSTPWLDGMHTNFGRVVDGMEVVEQIANVQTGANDMPTQPVTIESISIQTN